ncbi:DUF2961 domain-containing protein [Gilliamella sp. B3464]|nr:MULTISPECIES: DUF2961 domain-containing protein [unclassified Gilliamella]MCX8711259.1 DUF2961 domain-containing protein [Gilliamella sp. B3468]MCX8750309.1 DUF2961 domain-containing protein [Gilliamella sp. B3464]
MYEGQRFRAESKRQGCISIPAGKKVTIAEITGPAEIRHMWFTLTDRTHRGSFVLRDVVIRIYWDDEAVPSVESPIGDFFCNGFGARCDINSMPIVINPIGGLIVILECHLIKKPALKLKMSMRLICNISFLL